MWKSIFLGVRVTKIIYLYLALDIFSEEATAYSNTEKYSTFASELLKSVHGYGVNISDGHLSKKQSHGVDIFCIL